MGCMPSSSSAISRRALLVGVRASRPLWRCCSCDEALPAVTSRVPRLLLRHGRLQRRCKAVRAPCAPVQDLGTAADTCRRVTGPPDSAQLLVLAKLDCITRVEAARPEPVV
jgi:hypothetical protein